MRAYSLSSNELIYQPDKSIELDYEPQALAATHGTLAVLADDRTTIEFYQSGELVHTMATANTISSIALEPLP